MLRICLIIAIVGALAAGVINFVQVQKVIQTVVSQRDDERSKKEAAQSELKKTKSDLAATKKDLDSTKANLQQRNSDLQLANAKVADLGSSVSNLTAQLAKTRNDRDAAQQKLSQWDQLQVTIPEVKGMMSDLKKLTNERNALVAENKILLAKRMELEAKLNEFVGSDQGPPILPTGLKGKVLAVDPKYDFVVLDIGEENGLVPRGELMVDRHGKLIAKVRVASVLKDRSIANIIPGWTRGEVMEGDQVIY